jgi:hypothetical protein
MEGVVIANAWMECVWMCMPLFTLLVRLEGNTIFVLGCNRNFKNDSPFLLG